MCTIEALENRTFLSATRGVTEIVITEVENTSAQWDVIIGGALFQNSVQVIESRQMVVDVAGRTVSTIVLSPSLIVSVDKIDAFEEGSAEDGLYAAAGFFDLTDGMFVRDGFGGARLKVDDFVIGIDVGSGILLEIDLDVRWKGSGKTAIERVSSKETFPDEGLTIASRAMLQTRSAVLTGKFISKELNGNRPGLVSNLSPQFAATPVTANIASAHSHDITWLTVPKAGVFSLNNVDRHERLFA
jgi:hypothetical protein